MNNNLIIWIGQTSELINKNHLFQKNNQPNTVFLTQNNKRAEILIPTTFFNAYFGIDLKNPENFNLENSLNPPYCIHHNSVHSARQVKQNIISPKQNYLPCQLLKKETGELQ